MDANFYGKSRVAVMKTSPETVLAVAALAVLSALTWTLIR
jgi:hypothetical protein